jgi:hypothetical protein
MSGAFDMRFDEAEAEREEQRVPFVKSRALLVFGGYVPAWFAAKHPALCANTLFEEWQRIRGTSAQQVQ